MHEALFRIACFSLPATLGLLAIIVGRKPVRRLRETTGDESALTSILGGSAFGRPEKRGEAA